jgi:superfamily II DNA or RNA helicase
MANKKQPSSQQLMDFDRPLVPLVEWPTNECWPINRKDTYPRRTVLQEIKKDVSFSETYLVVTGFTSLAHIIEFFGKEVNFEKTKVVKIVLGFEPELKQRKFWKMVELDDEIKEFWTTQNYSLLNGGEVIRIIEYIKRNKITFRLLDGLHAKIYIGDTHAILGSANFSKNGTTVQQEANIRVANKSSKPTEKRQYKDISTIATNFYNEAKDYNKQIIALLEGLLKVTSWQEALSRAISELIDRHWSKDIPELHDRLKNIKLWPSQRMGIAQALYILQTQGCVLIADPTGSGKTKMVSTLQLVLFHWLWEIGRCNKSYATTVCPPLVKGIWQNEFIDLRFSNNEQISMGALSYTQNDSHHKYLNQIKISNILVIDEAHNFLNLKSNRSVGISEHTSDNVILCTATPINKKVNDLLRLIELLGVDNLNDKELIQFKALKRKKSNKSSTEDLNALRDYIKKFIVRRTKKDLNKLINYEPDAYKNRLGNNCRYPEHIKEIYQTGETDEDNKIAREINRVAKDLKGLIYLQDLSRPDYEFEYDESVYLEKRIKAAKALTVYNIQARLRSSRAALLEHIFGTQEALDHYGFKSKKSPTGNVVATLSKHSVRLPVNDFKEFSPNWLTDLNEYQKVCSEEILLYSRIAELSKDISSNREDAKVRHLLELFKKNKLVLAFDNTILTLDYLNTILHLNYPNSGINSFVITGNTNKVRVLNIIKNFELGSSSENILAFCSDSMSEGVNLQQASALVFLDMPSVVRIAEQRIGRIDRLDSPHKKITIYWPFDSEEYALRTDLKLISTSIDVDSLIGSNYSLPQELLDRHMDQIVRPADMIKILEEQQDQDHLWEGINDAFAPIHDLYDGESSIIKRKDYEYLKSIDASVKVKISIGLSEKPWLFIALKGSNTVSPRWYFIDSDRQIHKDLANICENLRACLAQTHQWEEKWNDDAKSEFGKYVTLLRENEISTLPSKRRRALEVAEHILTKKMSLEKDASMKVLIKDALKLFHSKPQDDEFAIDYYSFSQQWLDILTPYLYLKNKTKRGYKDVVSLNNLKVEFNSIDLSKDILEKLIRKVPLVPNIWSRIASCIIGIPKTDE